MKKLPPPKRFELKGLGMKLGRVGVGSNKEPEDLEKATRKEWSEAELALLDDKQQAIRAAVNKVAHDTKVEFDSEFWFCLVFQSYEQKTAFLEAMEWNADRDGDKYISGTRLAEHMGVKLPPVPKWKPAPAPKAKWAELAREVKDVKED